MANGGIASPADPIHMLQFSRDELRAAVEEAENLGTYVSAHTLHRRVDPPERSNAACIRWSTAT